MGSIFVVICADCLSFGMQISSFSCAAAGTLSDVITYRNRAYIKLLVVMHGGWRQMNLAQLGGRRPVPFVALSIFNSIIIIASCFPAERLKRHPNERIKTPKSRHICISSKNSKGVVLNTRRDEPSYTLLDRQAAHESN